MLGWTLVLLGAVFVGILISIVTDGEDDGAGVIVAFAFFVIWIFIVGLGTLDNKSDTAEFISFTAYTEMYGEYDGFTSDLIIQEKIEKNRWLFDAQASREIYGIFSLYPKEVTELEPIQ